MTRQSRGAAKLSAHRLNPEQLRWRCEPESFSFKTTAEMDERPIDIIGQNRAQEALRVGLSVRSDGYNIFVAGDVGSGRSTVVKRMLAELERSGEPPGDLVYVHNFKDQDQPRLLAFSAGEGKKFRQAMHERIDSLTADLPKLFESEDYRQQRNTMLEAASKKQKGRLREFEKKVQEQGFALVQIQMGPLVRPQIVPVVAGNPIDMDQLEALVEQGKFKRQEFQALQKKEAVLRNELESLGKSFRNMDRQVRRQLANLIRELAKPHVEETLAELRQAFKTERLDEYLDQVAADIMENLEQFGEAQENPEGQGKPGGRAAEIAELFRRYRVNLVVDHSATEGRPIIWETAPSYRNLFGTIEKIRAGAGEWESNHTCIKGGSLLRASGGFLVLDAMDVLAEPGVWVALKRTLRNRKMEIQSFDPFWVFSAISLKPEPVPIDVTVLMIGTRYIYSLLYALDEDFKKIFKVKAEFAQHTARSPAEQQNYARFVHKKVGDDGLPPFKREAVAAVVEHGVRLAGHQEKLTTRFAEVADLIRESGHWAASDESKFVEESHVERALRHRVYRVNMIEELLRERIAEGSVLVSLEGARVGQVNGLAVLDLGDHVFALPSRITATTAMGRMGIIDIDREAEMAGAIHTKGVLILTGFLRSRFAQDKPLALTASICFEQSYGGVEGDSASSAELYALISSLSEVPLQQGVAVTGSVNQKGEIQPIGGVNEKIEGFLDLCRLTGLTGEQGVMIPARNLPQLMLRKDVVAEVRKKRFHVWAVRTIDEGLAVLSGQPVGERGADGSLPPDSVLGRADAKLSRLAEQVVRFGPGDASRGE